jgi:RHS repeat-associated protein
MKIMAGDSLVLSRENGNGMEREVPSRDLTRLYYTKDHLGSIRELVDGTGTVRARYDYAPYGERTKLSGDLEADFGYTGHYTHAGSGLVLAPYRGYDPGTARWLSRDPIGEEGGINLYGYVRSNPTELVDPTGLDVWCDFGGGGHVSLTVTDPSSNTGDTSHSYAPANGAGYADWWRAMYTPGTLTVYSGKPSSGETRIPRTAEQDKAMRDKGSEISKKPGYYNVATNSCVHVAAKILTAGGIDVAKGITPGHTPQELSETIDRWKYQDYLKSSGYPPAVPTQSINFSSWMTK